MPGNGSLLASLHHGRASLSSFWTINSCSLYQNQYFIVLLDIRALSQVAVVYRLYGYSRVRADRNSVLFLPVFSRWRC